MICINFKFSFVVFCLCKYFDILETESVNSVKLIRHGAGITIFAKAGINLLKKCIFGRNTAIYYEWNIK